jgi:hypothetical protein
MVAAAVRCVARWGFAKTTVDDIAREAGVAGRPRTGCSPGQGAAGAGPWLHHELGRLFHEAETEAEGAETLEDLLCIGIRISMQMLTGHEALTTCSPTSPRRCCRTSRSTGSTRLLAYAAELSRPHLARFPARRAGAPGRLSWSRARAVLQLSARPTR